MTLIDMALPYQKAVITDKSKVKVMNFGRQEGKSWTCAFLAALKCAKKKKALVIYLSTGQRAADEALKKCILFAQSIAQLSNGSITYSANASCITFSNGSRIMSLPGNANATRGWSADLLICDEMSFWERPEEVWQGIVPTLTNEIAGNGKEIVICSTPLAKNSLFFELCQKAKTTNGWKYFEVNIEDAVRQGLKADIVELRKLISDPLMWQTEYMCQFSDSANALIDVNLLQWFVDRPPIKEYFIGVDWARRNDGTAIVVVGRSTDGRLHLVDVQLLHNVEYDKQIALATAMFRQYNPRLFYGDAGGLGNPLMESLNKKVSALIKPFTFNANNKVDAYEYFRKCVFDRTLDIDEQFKKIILDDIALVRQTISEQGKISYNAIRAGDSHADTMSALILALQAARESAMNMSMPKPVPFGSRLGGYQRRF